MKKIIKSLDVSYDLFEHLITRTSHFISARGVRYNIISVDGKEITFERAGAGKRFNWSFNLRAFYEAYNTIQNFENTRAFKEYFPHHYLQTRVLLLTAGLLELV